MIVVKVVASILVKGVFCCILVKVVAKEKYAEPLKKFMFHWSLYQVLVNSKIEYKLPTLDEI